MVVRAGDPVAVRRNHMTATGPAARADAGQGGHIGVVAMRTAPDLQVEIRQHHQVVVRDAEHGHVGRVGEATPPVDGAGGQAVVIAWQDQHRDGGVGQGTGDGVDQAQRHAVVVEDVAGQQEHVGAHGAGRRQHARQCVQLRTVLAGPEMQVRAVDQHQLTPRAVALVPHHPPSAALCCPASLTQVDR